MIIHKDNRKNNWANKPKQRNICYLCCCHIILGDVCVLLSTAMVKRRTQPTILMKSITPSIMKPIFSSRGLTVSQKNTSRINNMAKYWFKCGGDGLSYIQRESHPSRYDIKSDLALEEPGVVGSHFNLTFQVRTQTSAIPPPVVGILLFKKKIKKQDCKKKNVFVKRRFSHCLLSLRFKTWVTFQSEICSWTSKSQKCPKMGNVCFRYLSFTLTRWV